MSSAALRRPSPAAAWDASSSAAAKATTRATGSSSPGTSTSAAVEVRVLVWADPAELTGDAGANFNILRQTGVPIEVFGNRHDAARLAEQLAGADWIVDALLGTGARGEPRPPLDAVIDQLNAAAAKRLAVDLPSGLDCDTGEAAQHTIRADETCTFVAMKRGFTTPGAEQYTGRVHVLDIGARGGWWKRWRELQSWPSEIQLATDETPMKHGFLPRQPCCNFLSHPCSICVPSVANCSHATPFQTAPYFRCDSAKGTFQLLNPSLQLVDPTAKLLDLGRRIAGGNRLRTGRTERRPLRGGRGRRKIRQPNLARWRRDRFRSTGAEAGRRRCGGLAQLRCARRRAHDDFDPQRPNATDEFQRQAVARIEAVENGHELAQHGDLAACRGDDQILRLQAGAVGRSAGSDAQDPYAAAGIVGGKRAKIDPLGGGSRHHRRTVGTANARFQPIQSPCAAAGDVPPSPAANNTTIPMPQVFFIFGRPFLKGSLSHTMDAGRMPGHVPSNYTGIPPRCTHGTEFIPIRRSKLRSTE